MSVELRKPAAVDAWLDKAVRYLDSREVPESAANAEFMMGHVLGVGRAAVLAAGGRVLRERQGLHFWELVKERARRVPLAYVLGSQPFMNCDIRVTPVVLVPRPETEQLVEAVIEAAKADSRPMLHIVDIGTGSGCVPIALAKNLPGVMLYATEISQPALKVAEENARRHHVSHRIRFLREDLFKQHKTSPWADFVVSNPPYVPTAEVVRLAAEVRREPVLALDGGKDGLDAIRAIGNDVPHVLRPGGTLFLEFGHGQADEVRSILGRKGFERIEIRKDIGGHDRIAIARLPKNG